MSGASIEATLELWASSLRKVKSLLRPLFAQERAAVNAGLFLDGCLAMSVARRDGCAPRPPVILALRQQALLGAIGGTPSRCPTWCASTSWSISRTTTQSWLSIKPGSSSRARHRAAWRGYTGSAGKITNCQIGVFATYVSRHGHGFIDRALYLPKGWTDDPARLKATSVPSGVAFATKPQLAATMIERAIATAVPFRW